MQEIRGVCQFRASNKWIGANHNRSNITGFHAAKQELRHGQEFEMNADEPPMLAGQDQAPNPVEHLLHALASCVTTSMVAHAAVRGIEIEELESELEGDINLRGFLGLASEVPKGYTDIHMKFKVKTDEPNMAKLKSLAEFSPVYNSLVHGVNVSVELEPKSKFYRQARPGVAPATGAQATSQVQFRTIWISVCRL